MKRMIKIVAALAGMLCSGSAFAEGMAKYAKITGGFDTRWGQFRVLPDDTSPDYDSTLSFVNFAVTPTFGMLFAPDSGNGFLRGLGLEASLGVGIGGGREISIGSGDVISSGSLTLIPRVDAVWHLLTNGAKFGEQKFVMHFMTGFELPVFIPLSSTVEVEIGQQNPTLHKYSLVPALMLGWNVGAGFDLKLTDKLDFVADLYAGIILFSINAGIVYHLN